MGNPSSPCSWQYGQVHLPHPAHACVLLRPQDGARAQQQEQGARRRRNEILCREVDQGGACAPREVRLQGRHHACHSRPRLTFPHCFGTETVLKGTSNQPPAGPPATIQRAESISNPSAESTKLPHPNPRVHTKTSPSRVRWPLA